MWIIFAVIGLLVWGGLLLVVLSMCVVSARADAADHPGPALADLMARVPGPGLATRSRAEASAGYRAGAGGRAASAASSSASVNSGSSSVPAR
jgi:hypothetical protein